MLDIEPIFAPIFTDDLLVLDILKEYSLSIFVLNRSWFPKDDVSVPESERSNPSIN